MATSIVANQPHCSVIVPAYNAARWLAETLDSVAVASSRRIQLIVVNDGSTDDTGAVLERYPVVEVITTPNRGVSAARTVGFERARAPFVKFLDADDLLLPGTIDRQLDLAAQSHADVVYGNWQRLVERGDAWQHGQVVQRRIEHIDKDAEIAFFTLMWCPTAAYLWRTSFLQTRHPGWHASLPVIQDARFALDAARVGARFAHDSEISALYRVHVKGSVSTRSQVAFFRDCYHNSLEIEAHWRRGPLTDARRAALRASWNLTLRGSFNLDRSLFADIWEHVHSVDPTFIPGANPRFRKLSRLIGYPRTEWISAALRTILGRAPQTADIE